MISGFTHMLAAVLLLACSCGERMEDGPEAVAEQPVGNSVGRTSEYLTDSTEHDSEKLSRDGNSFSSVNKKGALGDYRIKNGPANVSRLPRNLDEISGLATTPDGRLFAHDDEQGVVYRLDAMTGSISAYFILGRTIVLEDFEGLAVAEGFFYLVTSDGELFKFREGLDRKRVQYEVISTPLARKNDVEGLCFDPDTRCLLLACKGSPGKGYKGKKAVYAFSLETNKLLAEPRFLLDENELAGKGKDFSPSAIERHPESGTFFILSSSHRAIVEISADGQVMSRGSVKKKHHPQPEGLTFLQLNEMVVGDEADKKAARLSVYKSR